MGYSIAVEGYKAMFTKRRSTDPNDVAYNYAGAPWKVAKRFDTLEEATEYGENKRAKLGDTHLFKIDSFGRRV